MTWTTCGGRGVSQGWLPGQAPSSCVILPLGLGFLICEIGHTAPTSWSSWVKGAKVGPGQQAVASAEGWGWVGLGNPSIRHLV